MSAEDLKADNQRLRELLKTLCHGIEAVYYCTEPVAADDRINFDMVFDQARKELEAMQ
jgi:hypothetical protein